MTLPRKNIVVPWVVVLLIGLGFIWLLSTDIEPLGIALVIIPLFTLLSIVFGLIILLIPQYKHKTTFSESSKPLKQNYLGSVLGIGVAILALATPTLLAIFDIAPPEGLAAFVGGLMFIIALSSIIYVIRSVRKVNR